MEQREDVSWRNGVSNKAWGRKWKRNLGDDPVVTNENYSIQWESD